ncbi:MULTISPECIES: hypothetical protein [unclassified Microcoleus]|nr:MULTISPECIES: hypothetical protein [unclassified Microcoleus]
MSPTSYQAALSRVAVCLSILKNQTLHPQRLQGLFQVGGGKWI